MLKLLFVLFVIVFVCMVDFSSMFLDEEQQRLLYHEGESVEPISAMQADAPDLQGQVGQNQQASQTGAVDSADEFAEFNLEQDTLDLINSVKEEVSNK